jgi:glycosyltransferase involved in cell wall biosynthesis
MKVSIIITSFNRPATVRWTIDSALRQTYADTQVIVVDASTDEEASHLSRTGASRMFYQLKSNRVIYFVPPTGGNERLTYLQTVNMGVEDARNTGVRGVATQLISGGGDTIEPICLGDALLFMDDDDWISPNFLERTVPLLQSGVGVVSTYMHVFSDTIDSVVETKAETTESMRDRNGIPFSSLIQREAFLQTNGFEKNVYDDWNLWVSILKRGWKHAVVPEPLFHYRSNVGSSLISRVNKNREERIANMKSLHPEILW